MTKKIVFGKAPALSLLSSSHAIQDAVRRHVDHGSSRRDVIGLRDIVGQVDMVGLRNIIGQRQLRALISQGVIRTSDVTSGEVVEREPVDIKRKILPIPETSVALNAIVRITLKPQELFKAKRLVIDPEIAAAFRIGNAKVATRDQFSGQGLVPASVFLPDAVDVNIDWDSCDVGEEIAFDVQNYNGGEDPEIFSGCFLGTSVY